MLILRLATGDKQVNLVLTVLWLLFLTLEHLVEAGLENALLQREADHGDICGQFGCGRLMRWAELPNSFFFVSKRKVVLLRLIGGLLHFEVAAILERLHCNRLGDSDFLRRVRRRVEI